jgi:hypothetical protein
VLLLCIDLGGCSLIVATIIEEAVSLPVVGSGAATRPKHVVPSFSKLSQFLQRNQLLICSSDDFTNLVFENPDCDLLKTDICLKFKTYKKMPK